MKKLLSKNFWKIELIMHLQFSSIQQCKPKHFFFDSNTFTD